MRDVVGLACACVMLIFSTAVEAQQPATSRETALIEVLKQQRDQAADGVAICYADAKKQQAEMQAKVADLEKQLAAVTKPPAKE